ncbi:MAG: thiolase domain-containing protein [Mesorhizobium sp.]|uniref:acetyl-CoA acetyltransferase n=1 Tax=Mesorhizobium sp. TaxID=1871066 RepID=UPI000FE71AFE|nr:acetyl-CoA acetyltransferase [Mesorhizobium sp.]RWP41757.1 MAG: thiolase domain-containing protein [Mesorhizobium sp.]
MLTCMVGWSHSRFGRLEAGLEELIVGAAVDAIADAGLQGWEIDEIFVGTFNPGLVEQDFASSLVLNSSPDLRFKPATRIENACATGSAAVYQAARAVESNRARFALVIGVEKMTALDSASVGRALLKASYVEETRAIERGFAGVFGQIASSYFQKYGDQSDALASIAAKNHRNAVANPLAHMRQDLGFEFCRNASDRNPIVAGPLKRTDCALISDGAAALVLTDAATALRMKKAVALRAMCQTSDYLQLSRRLDITSFEGAARAWSGAMAQARLTNHDLDFIELHDCFTISELIQYEALGIAARGEGARAIKDGMTEMDGELPVNPSGGLKARGHPVGATGVSMLVNAAVQLTGEAGDMQVKDARLAGVFNMGGVSVANYATILEPFR